ncbi:MAG: hypothetical protein B7Z38_06655 [Rhodobacterales bacterium 12-64-8]|nr:MAG: hypothetical protein B7Z38_06655 [Rhodobacterales bacterium 12-64-8]
MERDLIRSCPQHPDRYDCPDNLIVETERGFGLIVHDGGHSHVQISYCPWCGTGLSVGAAYAD